MKEKILSALKTKYKTLGFGDKAFEGVADYLSKQVTEESNIETAISGVESLLKAFQGDIDKVRGERSNLQKELDELKEKMDVGGNDPNPPKPGDDLDAKINAAVNSAVAAATKPLNDIIQGYQAKEKISERENLIQRKASELGIPEWRIKEGFTLKEDASEEDITSVLTSVKQNIVTAGLGGRPGLPINTEEKPSTEQTDAILSKMGYKL